MANIKITDTNSINISSLTKGVTYIFDQSNQSNLSHPLRISLTQDEIQYTTGWSYDGTPGSDGLASWTVPDNFSGDTIYFYCANHSGMGISNGVSIES